jgi:hypothetical protein
VGFGKFGEKCGGEIFPVTVGMLRGAGVGETEMVRTKPEVQLDLREGPATPGLPVIWAK